MISDPAAARRISSLMLDVSRRLDDSIYDVMASSPDNVEKYKRVIGALLRNIPLEVLNPLYKTHPDIKPVELK